MGYLRYKVRRLLTSPSQGFTLVEALVSLGIMGITLSLMGGAMFQALGITRYWQKDVIATKDVRHAGSWFARDALNAQTTDLVDGAPAVPYATISWKDKDGNPHTTSYTLLGNELKRSYDGQVITVARDVTSVGFSRSGKKIKFILTVNSSRGNTESKTLDTFGRMLQ